MAEGKRLIKKKHPGRTVLIVILAVIAALTAAAAVYFGIYYHADAEAESCIADPPVGVTVDTSVKGEIAFIPDEAEAGLIFYPGAKVQAEAYAPLMTRLAEKGVLCVIMKMPLNFALMGINAADGVEEQYPQVTDWYIGGHSLGGVAAAMYLKNHTGAFDGILLLASYTTVDFSAADLKALSVLGTEDGVLSQEQYDANRENLPADFTEVELPGGCHGQFGSYGVQKGDGTPTITAQQQWDETAEAVYEWMNS